MSQLPAEIFKAYDIRGIVNKSLTADIFNETGLGGPHEAFAEAFTALAREGSN